MPRENVDTRARRALVEGRVIVNRVEGRYVSATVRSDHGALYAVRHLEGRWDCPCDARGVCSHVRAVQLVTCVLRRVS
jgi:hypothetical protein